ncbi:hypothetical protein [Streptomyces sp. NPDC003327]
MERGIGVENGAGVVVIGHGNTVGTGAGAEPAVRSAYRQRIAHRAPAELVGREAELAELAAFARSGRGCLWWRADAWAGKTALMAWFALHPPRGVRVVPFFVTARWAAQNDATAYVDVVLEQLAELAGQGLPALLTPATREAHLLGMYDAAARACARRGERLVLLVDGLDEDRGVTTGPEAHSIAALLPYDLPVVVSGRLNPPLPPDVPEDHPLRDPAAVRILAPSPAARAVRSEAERELKNLRAAGGLPYDLLGLLTAAGGGLTADDLAELAEESRYEVGDLLRTSAGRTFARVGDAYLLAHEELQRLAAEMLGPREVRRYRESVDAWAEQWRARGWPEGTPAYLLRGWFPSLRAGGDLERMVGCALDGARHERLLAATGGDLTALTEITATEAALVDAGVPDLLVVVRLVMAREELTGRSDCIPPALPWAWAKLGRYDRAEGLARSIVSDDWRARALADLARQLHDAGRRGAAVPLLGAALEAATRCENVFGDEREQAFEEVGRASAHVGRFDRAVEAARRLEDPWRRADLLGEVSRAWSAAGEHDRALALCRAEGDPTARARLLATTAACRAGRGDVEGALRLAAEAGPEGEILPLARVASVLRGAGDARADGLLDRVDALVRPSAVLLDVVEVLAESGEYERAAAAAEACGTPEARDWAVGEVVAALAAAGLRDRARAVAGTIRDAEAGDAALRGIVTAWAAALAADPSDLDADADGLGAAVALARSIDEDREREVALRALVQALAEAGAFDRAEALARGAAPFRTLSRQPLGVVVEALAPAGHVRRARELVPDVPYGEGGFSLVRGVVAACPADDAEAVAAAVAVVTDVEDRVRAEAQTGKLNPFHTALALAKEGFGDRARALLCDAEDRLGEAGGPDEDDTAPLGLPTEVASAVEALARLGEFERAGVLLRRLRDLPSTYMAAIALVQQLCEQGLFDRADAVAETFEGSAREGMWGVLAEGAADFGDPARAESYARRLTATHECARALTAAAAAHARAGDRERAEACLDEGLSLYENGPYAFMTVPWAVRALFALGREEAGNALLADVVARAEDPSHWMVSRLLTETVRGLVAVGAHERARAFVRSLPDEDGTVSVWIALVMALHEAGEHAAAADEVRSRGLPDGSEGGRMPFGWGRLVRVVEPASGRVLLARLLRSHNLEDLLADVLFLEPAAAALVCEACAPVPSPRP